MAISWNLSSDILSMFLFQSNTKYCRHHYRYRVGSQQIMVSKQSLRLRASSVVLMRGSAHEKCAFDWKASEQLPHAFAEKIHVSITMRKAASMEEKLATDRGRFRTLHDARPDTRAKAALHPLLLLLAPTPRWLLDVFLNPRRGWQFGGRGRFTSHTTETLNSILD